MSDSQLPTSPASRSSSASSDILRDIFLWRKKKLSAILLLTATVTWVVLEFYQFNFITVASWVVMAIVGSLFFWANILRLLGKETPNMSELEISEQSAETIANSLRECIEEGIRWMFTISAEREWFVFAGTVSALWLLSKVGGYFDLLTLLYIVTVVGMTVPVIYMKYEDKIKRYADGVKLQWRKFCDMVDEKVIQKTKHKFMADAKKEKKVE